ncbi:MAG: hypothetical protein ACREHC_01550 [Candidatus Levyibacteriota bacterium]
MRKAITNPNHLINKIILTTYIFRSLPLQYVEKVSSYNNVQSQKQKTALKSCIINDYLKVQEEEHGISFIRLTKKGYLRAITLLPQKNTQQLYTFRRDRSTNFQVAKHPFYNFVYIWWWIEKFSFALQNDIQIYDDSNLNYCKLSFTFGGKKIVISPDVLIYGKDPINGVFKQAHFVENDAGGETYKRLYHKLIEYALLATHGFGQNAISQATLTFIFHSEKRMNKMLYGKEGILNFFDYSNTSLRVKNIPIELIFEAFAHGRFSLYCSYYHKDTLETPYQFQQFDLTSQLLERRKEWNIYQ